VLPLALFFAAIIGLALGMLGGGGSILTVPVLVYVLHIEPKLAIAMSLPIVGFTSAFGAWRHARIGNVQLRRAFLFGGIAMTGAYAGGRVARYIDPRVQLAILGAMMAGAAVSMLRSAARHRDDAPVPHETSPFLYLVGLGVGLLTGLVGVGGGFLIVPALVVFGSVPIKQAVGTSLAVIAMNCAAGFAGQSGEEHVRWGFVAAFTVVTTAGLLAGTAIVPYVRQVTLKRGFAVLLLIISALVLWNNRSLL